MFRSADLRWVDERFDDDKLGGWSWGRWDDVAKTGNVVEWNGIFPTSRTLDT